MKTATVTKFKESEIKKIVVVPTVENGGLPVPPLKELRTAQVNPENETMFVLMDSLKKKNTRIEELELRLEAAKFDAQNNLEALQVRIKAVNVLTDISNAAILHQRDLERTNERLCRENEEYHHMNTGLGVQIDTLKEKVEQYRAEQEVLNKEIARTRSLSKELIAMTAAYARIPRWIRWIFAK